MTKEIHNKLLSIIQQIFITKISSRFIGNVQVNHFLFLTIDSTLPANDSLRFIKTLLLPYKNDIN